MPSPRAPTRSRVISLPARSTVPPNAPTEPRAMRPQARYTPVPVRNDPERKKQNQVSAPVPATPAKHTSSNKEQRSSAKGLSATQTENSSSGEPLFWFDGPADLEIKNPGSTGRDEILAGLAGHWAVLSGTDLEAERKRAVLGWGDEAMVEASRRTEKWRKEEGDEDMGVDDEGKEEDEKR